MHKDSCDAPWICKLPPMNKKKYVKWTDGTLICGKRCSTKHNLIKHLKALHTNHRIIDLSQSVKAQSIKVKSPSDIYYIYNTPVPMHFCYDRVQKDIIDVKVHVKI